MRNTIALVMLAALLAACSANQLQLSSQLMPTTNDDMYELQDAVTIKASNASPSTLNAGTSWQQVGQIERGKVYRTRDQVVILNSFDVHEGYIVVSDAQVVGYYLPIEKTFVETKPVSIAFVKRGDTQ